MYKHGYWSPPDDLRLAYGDGRRVTEGVMHIEECTPRVAVVGLHFATSIYGISLTNKYVALVEVGGKIDESGIIGAAQWRRVHKLVPVKDIFDDIFRIVLETERIAKMRYLSMTCDQDRYYRKIQKEFRIMAARGYVNLANEIYRASRIFPSINTAVAVEHRLYREIERRILERAEVKEWL